MTNAAGPRFSPVGWLARHSPIYYGWWVIVFCAVNVFVLGGFYVYAFGVLFTPIQQELGWTTVEVAFAFALRSEVGAVISPVIGFLVDHYGPRRVMILGLIIMGIGFLWLSTINTLLAFYTCFVVISIGNTICVPSQGIVAASRWFQRKRSRAISVLVALTGMSGVTAPMLNAYVERWGWRQSLVFATVTGWIVGFPTTALVGDHPRDYGLHPDGEQPTPDTQPPADTEHARKETQGSSIKGALRNRNFWLLAISHTLVGLGNSTILALLVPSLTKQGIQPTIAALVVGALPVISVPARLLFGWAGDFADKRKLLALCYGLQALGLVILAMVNGNLMLAVFALIFGLARGGPLPLQPALQADFFGTAAMGSIQGMLSLGSSLTGFIGPVLIAWLVDASGAYPIAWLVLSGMMLTAVPLLLATKPPTKEMAAA